MFSPASFAFVVTAVSSVSGLVVPRATPPAGWATDYLEPYDTYHTRYLAIGCISQHNTPFFDKCCHPLLATQNAVTDLPASCTSSLSASPTSSALIPTPSDDSDDDEEDDCDEDGDSDEFLSSAAAPSTPTPAVTTTPTTTRVPSTTPNPVKTTTLTKASPSPTPSKATDEARVEATSASQSVNSGGFATFFYQNGVAGACGTVHRDSDLIAAIDGERYGNLSVRSSLCGKQVKITNPANNKSVVVTIADACPTCENRNSIDLSLAAFKQIGTLDQGMVDSRFQIGSCGGDQLTVLPS
ncbi:hypothetical protein J132_07291 [Termitomyces sp. J132]|nr:hypothetical protein J132_07291 [Termitomyces sp. J132]